MLRRPTAAALVLAAALGLGGILAAGPAARAADAFDAAASARYLDARMDVWWTKTKTLRTGSGETKCLSCHTAVPYALARPVLRRVMGVAAPTAHEERIMATVRQRVESAENQAPFYDHTPAKKTESLGVEAVMNAWLLTRYETLGRSALPSDTTRTAIARLWQTQRADGAWDWLDFGLEPYETADAAYHGATIAAMAAGSVQGRAASQTPVGKAGTERLRTYLRDGLASQRLFNKTWALMASVYFPGMMDAAARDGVVKALDAAQQADGGWTLASLGEWRWSKSAAPYAAPGKDVAPVNTSDAYATALVVHALRQAGVPVSQGSVSRGQAWLRAHQTAERTGDEAWAPWRSHSLNFDREHGGDKGEPWRRMFMSDLATAFAVLALN